MFQGCGSGWDRETGECQVLNGSLGASHRECVLYPSPALPAADLLPPKASGSCGVQDGTKGEGARICGSDSGKRKMGISLRRQERAGMRQGPSLLLATSFSFSWLFRVLDLGLFYLEFIFQRFYYYIVIIHNNAFHFAISIHTYFDHVNYPPLLLSFSFLFCDSINFIMTWAEGVISGTWTTYQWLLH